MRERLGAALVTDDILGVAEEVCAAEEREMRRAPEPLTLRCDREGSERVSWYRRHRPFSSSTVPFGKPEDEKGAPTPVTLVDIHARAGTSCPGAAGSL